MTELKFTENIRYIKIALKHYGLEHLLEGVELTGCWEEAGKVVSQIKDNVPENVLEEIYSTIDTPRMAYYALLNIDSTVEIWRKVVAQSPRYAYYALHYIDSSVNSWKITVCDSPKYAYMALLYVDKNVPEWRNAVAQNVELSKLALLRIDATYQPWLETVA